MSDTIANVDSTIFDRVWRAVEEIGVLERHFNELQTGYRNMASAWLLAAFAGIGFSLSKTLRIPIPIEFLVAAVAAAGCIGITLLWILDLLVYHRLLDSCFIEGLLLEEKYPWLPSLRSNMMKTQAGKGVLSRAVGFYLVPIDLLLLIVSGALSVGVGYMVSFTAAAAVAVAGVCCTFLATRTILAMTENTAAIEAILASKSVATPERAAAKP